MKMENYLPEFCIISKGLLLLINLHNLRLAYLNCQHDIVGFYESFHMKTCNGASLKYPYMTSSLSWCLDLKWNNYHYSHNKLRSPWKEKSKSLNESTVLLASIWFRWLVASLFIISLQLWLLPGNELIPWFSVVYILA